MTDRERMQQAMEAIDWLRHHLTQHHGCLHMNPVSSGIPAWLDKTETALRERLAQPEQEPFAYSYFGIKSNGEQHGPHLTWKPEYMDAMSASMGAVAVPLYTAPPQRKPLTDEEIDGLRLTTGYAAGLERFTVIARAVIAAYERKNGITGEQT